MYVYVFWCAYYENDSENWRLSDFHHVFRRNNFFYFLGTFHLYSYLGTMFVDSLLEL